MSGTDKRQVETEFIVKSFNLAEGFILFGRASGDVVTAKFYAVGINQLKLNFFPVQVVAFGDAPVNMQGAIVFDRCKKLESLIGL